MQLARGASPSGCCSRSLCSSRPMHARRPVWRSSLAGAGAPYSLRSLIPLSLAKVFIDQLLPSGGLSGAVILVRGLARRGIDAAIAGQTLLVALVSFYSAYLDRGARGSRGLVARSPNQAGARRGRGGLRRVGRRHVRRGGVVTQTRRAAGMAHQGPGHRGPVHEGRDRAVDVASRQTAHLRYDRAATRSVRARHARRSGQSSSLLHGRSALRRRSRPSWPRRSLRRSGRSHSGSAPSKARPSRCYTCSASRWRPRSRRPSCYAGFTFWLPMVPGLWLARREMAAFPPDAQPAP